MFGLGVMEIVVLLAIAFLLFVVPIGIIAVVLLILSRQKDQSKSDAEP